MLCLLLCAVVPLCLKIYSSVTERSSCLSENTVLIVGLKCVGAAGEIITLNLNGKVMLLLKQQNRSRLNL